MPHVPTFWAEHDFLWHDWDYCRVVVFFQYLFILYFRSLIDVVYALKDEVLELKKVNEKWL